MLRQLATFSSDIFQALDKLYSAHQAKRSRPSRQELESQFEMAVRLVTKVYIVIDALDECKVDICNPLIAKICGQMSMSHVHVFATSRDVERIRILFRNDMSFRIAASRGDIEKYVEHRIAEFPENIQCDRELRMDAVRRVVDAADGM
jgi:hypothetical protein